jgi:hypothetical protein
MSGARPELASAAALRAAGIAKPASSSIPAGTGPSARARAKAPRDGAPREVSAFRPRPVFDFPEFRARGPEAEWVPAMVRQLFLDGMPIERARTTAQIAAVMAFKPGIGRPPKGPRIVGRVARGAGGRRMAYVMYRRRPISLGVPLKKKEKADKNGAAKAAFVRWVEDKCRLITQQVLARDWTLKGIFDRWLDINDPKKGVDPTLDSRYSGRKSHVAGLRRVLDDELFIDVKANTGERYLIECCQRFIERNGTPTQRKYLASTAVRHVDTLIYVLDRFCEDFGFDKKKIRRPSVPTEEARWLTWDQIWRLLRACRGKIQDRAGKVVGRHDKRARYEGIERWIMTYFYGGTRDENGRNISFGVQMNKPGVKPKGSMDPQRGKLRRQGPGARVSNKKRGTSGMIGSLSTMSVNWKKKDLAKREALGVEAGMRYTTTVYDENGYALTRSGLDTRLAEVCEYAGLDPIDGHILKHSGVTICSLAGMPLPMVSQEFSTSISTLLTTYSHLHHDWFHPAPFDPKNLRFLNLRKFSPESFEKVYGVAPAA